MNAACAGCWTAVLALMLAGAAAAQPVAPAAPAASARPAAVPPAKASAPAAKAATPAAKASAPVKAGAARVKSLKVKVMFVESATEAPKPVAGAVVRLQGSEQTFATNAAGVAEVFGVLEGKPQLTVIVVNASICNLPIAPAGGTVAVLVPKRGQGVCRIGP